VRDLHHIPNPEGDCPSYCPACEFEYRDLEQDFARHIPDTEENLDLPFLFAVVGAIVTLGLIALTYRIVEAFRG
jgi:hypothetical protein